MTHRFSCTKVVEEELSAKYEFKLESGKADAGLLKTVFGEYIEEPILMKSQDGQSFVMIGQCPLMDKMMHYTVIEDAENNKICFTISSQLLKNKVVDTIEAGENIMHIRLSDGTMVRLKNATDRAISQIFYMFVLLDILNGMIIEVNIDDYYPNCRNCCMNKCNVSKYLKLAVENVRLYFEDKTGCLVRQSKFDETKKIVECGSFIRNKNPDIREILATISVLPEIENL
jgi:hypothetical protein